MQVYKFGGSILKNEKDIQIIKELLVKEKQPIVCVFSAFYGITDKLLDILKLAKIKSNELEIKISEINDFHTNLCKQLEIESSPILKYLNQIKEIAYSVSKLEYFSPKILDSFLIYGELLSSRIIHEYISKFIEIEYGDSRDLIKTDSNFTSAKVDFKETEKKILNFVNLNKKYIIPGFIGSDRNNESTTLGRNGSDYSAAIVAAILKAKNLIIWKDVDGIFTADPKIVKNPIFIDRVSYKEMIELSYFGNKVIAFKALDPAIKNSINITIKNLNNQESSGSLISNETNQNYQIKGVTKLDEVCVLMINSDKNRINGNSFYKKIFEIFVTNKIEPIFFNKSSSDINFTVGIKSEESSNIINILESEFVYELLEKKIISFNSRNMSIVSVIGFNLTKIPGIIYKISNFLQKENITIPIIIDSLSDYNISIGVDANYSNKVIQLLHSSFFDS